VSMHAAALTSAAQLPADLRVRFVDSVTAAAASATNASGVDGCAAGSSQFCALATTAFHQGVAEAAQVSLLLPAAVLLLGALACMAVGRTRSTPVDDRARPGVTTLNSTVPQVSAG
jgi:hypothetical protein